MHVVAPVVVVDVEVLNVAPALPDEAGSVARCQICVPDIEAAADHGTVQGLLHPAEHLGRTQAELSEVVGPGSPAAEVLDSHLYTEALGVREQGSVVFEVVVEVGLKIVLGEPYAVDHYHRGAETGGELHRAYYIVVLFAAAVEFHAVLDLERRVRLAYSYALKLGVLADLIRDLEIAR